MHKDLIVLQQPESFRVLFLLQIRPIVTQTSLGLPNLKMKGKTKRILVVVAKRHHRANGLLPVKLQIQINIYIQYITKKPKIRMS